MYKYISHKINDNQIKYWYTVDNNNQNCRGFDEISYAEFIHLLKSENKDFLKVFYETLNDETDKLSAYFWECIPVSQKLINKKFELVVTKSEELNNITLDSEPFAKHLADIAVAGTCAGSFLNKGKDAILVIPGAKKDNDKENIIDYKNISQFTKNASQEQQQKFWQEVANRLSKELEKNEAPKWLSTHGLGVYYLHVRIDNYPKYYHFEEYKAEQNHQENNSQNGSSQPSKDKLTPLKEEALDNKQEDDKGSLPLKVKKKTSQNLDEKVPTKNILANSSSIEQENTAKTNSQKDKLLLISGIGVILLIGIGSVIWWKWKKYKINQK